MTETKGRPTPKRADVRAAKKKPLVAPRGKTAARAGSKGGGKADARSRRAANAELRASMREAMRTGDERNYPPMAAGPERAAVRDVVDGRRSFGRLVIPGWGVGVALALIPTAATRTVASIVFPLLIGMVLADGVITARAIRAELARRWPDGTDTRRRALVAYGIARNMQLRRSRLPKPKVWRGESVA